MSKYTKGPWRWEFNKEYKNLHLVGGQKRFDLTIMDFERWGMRGATMRLRDPEHNGMQLLHRVHERADWITPEPGREHHKNWHQLLTHPDALLMEASPELYEALKRLHDSCVRLRFDGIKETDAEANARMLLERLEGLV